MSENILEKIIKKKVEKIESLKRNTDINSLKELINNIIQNIKKALSIDKKKLHKSRSLYYKKNTPKNIALKIISHKYELKKEFKDLT